MTVNEESMNPADEPVVLVVEDEPDVAETYKLWLAADYDVRLAESGDAALGMIDETVDIVLLDRMMPGMSGTEVLAKIRDRGYDCRVAMVSAVDPDFDIIEMGFDDYVTKPPTRDGLLETVEELGERGQRAERVQEYRSLLAKQAALETQKTEDELEASEEYSQLLARLESVQTDLESEQDRLLDDAEFVGSLRAFEEEER
jgi:DNA-binding response OmpR family regulator